MKTVNSPCRVVKEKKTGVLIFLLIFAVAIIFSMSYVSSLEARVLGGKMVLHGKTGETIRKSMKILNNNSFEVRINLVPDGDLKNSITFEENNFTIAPKGEKDAYFNIKITKEGRSDSTINIKFIASDLKNGKNGVVIPASIIVFAEKGNESINSGDNNTATGGENTTGSGDIGGSDSGTGISPVTIGLIITAIVFIILLALLFLYSKNKNKFKNGGKKEGENKLKKRDEK